MTQQPRIPDLETRQRNVARMREACRLLDAWTLKLDEVLAMLEADNRRQRQERLDGKYRRVQEKVGE
jgi:predicted ATPase